MTAATLGALQSGQLPQALELASLTIIQYPQAGHMQRLLFVTAAERIMVPVLQSMVKTAMEMVFGHTDVDNQRLFPAWFYIFQRLPVCMPLLDEELDWKTIEPALADKFVIDGVRNLNFLDWNLEAIFTRLRRDILLKHLPSGTLKTKHLPFLCALAEHCFCNGYVFRVEDDELAAVDKIMPDNPIAVAVIGCYKPLADVPVDEKMSAVAGFRAMMNTQIRGNRDEQKMVFPRSPAISAAVSQSVQAMYEEDPYPRWSTINMPHLQAEDIKGEILLAGCGTGQTALGFSAALPNCDFMAIDLSRASLAYAARMAKEHGVENICFAQMDILEAATLERKFDYIECSGVLHHMEDPEAGWRSLVACLKPGGGMQIALYSIATRGEIDRVRELIREKGYRPVRADIRKLRADIAALPDDDPRKAIMRMRDFYTTSMARDLVFHIQETAYAIPELAAMMDRLGLVFDGFKIPDDVKAAYRERFKDDPAMTNLKNWDAFEKDHPDTFVGMYRLFCHKQGENVSETVTRIREIQA